MPQITDLKLQRNRRVANVFVDNQFVTGLDLETIAKQGIKIGLDISQTDLKKIIQKSASEKLLNYALNFLSYRPRSEKEIRTYLSNKVKTGKILRVGETIIDNTIDKLKKDRIIDDVDFAKWWIEQRMKFRPKGKLLLSQELFIKGIDKEIIQNALSQIDEQEAARAIVQKKKKMIKTQKYQVAKKKLIGLLYRRGFTWEVIKNVVDETVPKK